MERERDYHSYGVGGGGGPVGGFGGHDGGFGRGRGKSKSAIRVCVGGARLMRGQER